MYIITYTCFVNGEYKDIFYTLRSEEDCREALKDAKDLWGKALREWYITKALCGGFVGQ